MKTQYAWLIELAASEPAAPQYWAGSSLFSGDIDMAIRFARHQDAERAAMMMLDGMRLRICEHGWDVHETGDHLRGRMFTSP